MRNDVLAAARLKKPNQNNGPITATAMVSTAAV
jgi:hypothetical protein